MTAADPAVRRGFVADQISALVPLDFLVVAVPAPPFDALQVLRNEDGSLSMSLTGREEPAPAFTPEQVTALARLGLLPPADGKTSWDAAAPPASAADAARMIDEVLSDVLGVEPGTPVDVRHGSERELRLAERRVAEMRATIEPVVSAMTGGAAPVQDGDGDYLLDLGHVRVFVAPRALPGRPPPVIRVFAITNAGVTLTPELGLFLSRLNFSLMFGRFSIDSENSAIWFDETLLGDHVTAEELRFTVEMVAATANEWDQKIAAMFGGRVQSPDAGAADVSTAHKPGQGGYL